MITHGELNEAVKELEGYEDRLVVIVDEYKSGRECFKCAGKGHLGIKCKHCKGTGLFKARQDEGPCPDCEVGHGPLAKSLGYVSCDLCSGTGTSSIVIPEAAEKRPTTGVIVSLGPLCGYFRSEGQWVSKPPEACLALGDRIFFTLYSGNEYQLGPAGHQITIRILKNAEILGRIKTKTNLQLEPQRFEELSQVGMNDD